MITEQECRLRKYL